MEPPRDDLQRLADRSLPQAIRRHAPWQQGSRLADAGGVVLQHSASGMPLPFLNCAVREDPGVAPDEVLRCAAAFYPAGARYALFTQSGTDGDLEARLPGAGFACKDDSPAMLLRQPVEPPSLAAPWRLDWVATLKDVEDFARACAGAYASLGLPEAVAHSYFGRPQGLIDDAVAIALARGAEGTAAACALVLLDAEVAGIYWVGALPQARGAGLAHACTAAAANRAFAHGARAVTLQATAMGEPLYGRMGFRTYGRVRRWVSPKA
jgi:GNAT superfamily N-acetyltransferase